MKAKLVEIKTALQDGGIGYVSGTIFKIKGFDEQFCVHEDGPNWEDPKLQKMLYTVTELSTGMTVTKDHKSKASAKSKADIRMRSNIANWPGKKNKAIKKLKNCGIAYPVNPLSETNHKK